MGKWEIESKVEYKNNNENDFDDDEREEVFQYYHKFSFKLCSLQGNNMEASNGSCNTCNAYTKERERE